MSIVISLLHANYKENLLPWFSANKQNRFYRPVYIYSCCHGNGIYVSLTVQKPKLALLTCLLLFLATKGSRVLEIKVNETQVSKTVFGHLKENTTSLPLVLCGLVFFSWFTCEKQWPTIPITSKLDEFCCKRIFSIQDPVQEQAVFVRSPKTWCPKVYHASEHPEIFSDCQQPTYFTQLRLPCYSWKKKRRQEFKPSMRIDCHVAMC